MIAISETSVSIDAPSLVGHKMRKREAITVHIADRLIAGLNKPLNALRSPVR